MRLLQGAQRHRVGPGTIGQTDTNSERSQHTYGQMFVCCCCRILAAVVSDDVSDSDSGADQDCSRDPSRMTAAERRAELLNRPRTIHVTGGQGGRTKSNGGNCTVTLQPGECAGGFCGCVMGQGTELKAACAGGLCRWVRLRSLGEGWGWVRGQGTRGSLASDKQQSRSSVWWALSPPPPFTRS